MDPDITVVTNIPAPKVIKLIHKYYCFYLTTNTVITIVVHVQNIDEGNVTLILFDTANQETQVLSDSTHNSYK